jgi:hypothetical protein
MSNPDQMPSLTPNQILALVVLMAEARELDNNELKEIAGFSLKGVDNKRLESLGLVETDRTHRPFSHQLTDKGWRLVRDLPGTVPPRQGRSAIRSLFTLLANVQRSLDRLQVSPPEFFKRTGEAVAPVVDDVEARIRGAYQEVAKVPGSWVGLADLRERLGHLDREVVDQTLRAMVRRDDVRIIPAANVKALEERDHAAAVRIGDEDSHAIAIGRS